MKEKEYPVKDLNVEEKQKIPNIPGSLKKTEYEQINSSIKQNLPKKKTSPMASIKDKINLIIGRSKTDASNIKQFNEFKNQALKQSQTGLSKIKKYQNTTLSPMDNESLSSRIYELEDHLIELHSAFDNFVIKSEQFLNYEQFIELRKDSEERIRTLDNLQKSIEESKNQIFKDTAYMDDIIEGFTHLKNKIEMLEKKTDDLSKKIGNEPNHHNFMHRLLGKPGTLNTTSGSESVTLANIKKEIAEMHGQMENIKKSEEKSIIGMDTINKLKRQIDEMSGKIDKMNNNRPKNEIKSNVDSRIDALQVQSNVINRADFENFVREFNKSQDQLKEEISGLKRDFKNQASKNVGSKRVQNESVKNVMPEMRKEVNEKIHCESKIVRDKEISDLRANIERLKAISQEL